MTKTRAVHVLFTGYIQAAPTEFFFPLSTPRLITGLMGLKKQTIQTKLVVSRRPGTHDRGKIKYICTLYSYHHKKLKNLTCIFNFLNKPG
jgi:hypothetical protein